MRCDGKRVVKKVAVGRCMAQVAVGSTTRFAWMQNSVARLISKLSGYSGNLERMDAHKKKGTHTAHL